MKLKPLDCGSTFAFTLMGAKRAAFPESMAST